MHDASSVFMVHSFSLVILEHVDQYLNFQAGIFPMSGDACCWDVQGEDEVVLATALVQDC